jgi:hypothetical protein
MEIEVPEITPVGYPCVIGLIFFEASSVCCIQSLEPAKEDLPLSDNGLCDFRMLSTQVSLAQSILDAQCFHNPIIPSGIGQRLLNIPKISELF